MLTLSSLALLSVLTACGAKAPAADAKPSSADKATDAAAKTAQAKPDKAGAAPKAVETAEATEPAQGAVDCDDPNADALAASCEPDRNARPTWLTKDLIPHVEVLRDSAANAGIGTKTWGIQLRLDDKNFSIKKCVEHLKAQLKPHVPRLAEPETGEDGRMTVAGETPDHFVQFICGKTEKYGLTVFIGANSK